MSPPEERPAAEFGKDIAEITKSDGEKNEAAMKTAAKMFGLKQEDLSEEEWAALVKVGEVLSRKDGGKRGERRNKFLS